MHEYSCKRKQVSNESVFGTLTSAPADLEPGTLVVPLPKPYLRFSHLQHQNIARQKTEWSVS